MSVTLVINNPESIQAYDDIYYKAVKEDVTHPDGSPVYSFIEIGKHIIAICNPHIEFGVCTMTVSRLN